VKKNKTPTDILENIRWFIKFPLKKRLELSEQDSNVIKFFRKLKIEKDAVSKRSN
jgi:hypothetical protein